MGIRSLSSVALAAGIAGLLPFAAQAQTASQLTPDSYAPRQERAGGPVVLPADTAAVAPEGAEAIDVRVVSRAVEGADAADPAVVAARTRLEGRTVSVAEIYSAAAELEAAFARRGLVLARVVVPAQTLAGAAEGAAVRLRLVRGRSERIDASALAPHVRERALQLLAPLTDAPEVRLRDIERRLLLVSDIPGLTVRSTLAAGTSLGASVLVLGGSYRPVTGFASYDNLLSDSLGRGSFGLGFNFNSVFGAGESLYLRASGLLNTGDNGYLEPHPRNRSIAGGMAVPLGGDGVRLGVEAANSRTTPRRVSGVAGSGSVFDRFSATLSYPRGRSRALTRDAEARCDASRERVAIIDPIDLPLSEDRLRVFRLEARATLYPDDGGYLIAAARLSQGVRGLGARTAADADPLLPLSRAGADADFTTLGFGVQAEQPLAAGRRAAVTASAQTSVGQPLVNGEQFGVARRDAISPLPSGAEQGDAGYSVRGELRTPFDLGAALPVRIAPYVFGARAGVRLYRPTAFERRETGYGALGLGLRASLLPGGNHPILTGGAEYGRAHVEGFGEADRVTFSVALQF